VQQRDEHAPPVLSTEVIARPPGEDIWQGLGEPITVRFQ
jgi:hypothetical protein